MLMLTESTEMTSAERHAARVADRVGSRFPVRMMAILALVVLAAFLMDHDIGALLHRIAFVALVGVMEWEHVGFSRLIEARDEEIQRLDEELRQIRLG